MAVTPVRVAGHALRVVVGLAMAGAGVVLDVLAYLPENSSAQFWAYAVFGAVLNIFGVAIAFGPWMTKPKGGSRWVKEGLPATQNRAPRTPPEDDNGAS